MPDTAPKSDKSGKIYFIVGLILALLIWGLQLVGVTVNVYLGGFVLAVAFVLMAYAFWIWEGGSQWHVWLRIGTIAVAALLYLALIGRQVISEWRQEHLSAHQTQSQPIQPPDEQPKAETPPVPMPIPKASAPKTPKPAKSGPSESASPKQPQVMVSGEVKQGGNGDCQANSIGGNATIENCSSGPPETVHSLVAIAKISCERKPEVAPPVGDVAFQLTSGGAGATLIGYNDSQIMLRPVSPITREVGADTIDVIERYSLDPDLKPLGEAVDVLKNVKIKSIKMVGWGFGAWCARPVQANVSLLLNGQTIWKETKPLDETFKLEYP